MVTPTSPTPSKTAGTSGRPLIFGRGDQPIPFVSVLDVAAVASRAATDSTLRGQVLEIAGEPITMTELSRALQNARRWPGSPRYLPRPLLSALSILARPLNPAFARQSLTALAMDTGLLSVGVPDANALDLPRQTLADVLARFTAT